MNRTLTLTLTLTSLPEPLLSKCWEAENYNGSNLKATTRAKGKHLDWRVGLCEAGSEPSSASFWIACVG